MDCPKCGEECWRDEVDVGVGVICGPWGCSFCCWSEDSYYDRSDGPSPAQIEHPDHYVDSCGGMIPLEAIENKLSHFGLPGKDIMNNVFKVQPDTQIERGGRGVMSEEIEDIVECSDCESPLVRHPDDEGDCDPPYGLLCKACLETRFEMLSDEVRSVLAQLDHLAALWGDEGVFRRCRDGLRAALKRAEKGVEE